MPHPPVVPPLETAAGGRYERRMLARFTCSVTALAAALTAWGCASGPSAQTVARIAARERIHYVDGAVGRLRVSDGGTGGPAVVFVHGLGSDLEAWRAQLDHLRPARRAIAYDQRGHGGSDPARDPAEYSIDGLADDLERVAFALGLDRFFLVGHSLSGTVLTSYAAAHPEKVAGLVYADALGDFHGVPRERLQEYMKREASPSFGRAEQRKEYEEILGKDARPTTRERVLASLERMDRQAFAALERAAFTFDARPLLARYRGPRLAIEVGEHPQPVLFSALDPSVQRVALSGVSHWLMMDDPEAFDRALDAFIGFSGSQ